MTVEIARYVHTVWCDDIRQEVGNKPSFMGVFTGGLLLPSLPLVLGRLGLHSWVVSPVDRPVKHVGIQVVRDDGTVIFEVQHETQPGQIKEVEGATRSQFVFAVILGPVEVPVTCKWFMVKAIADGETLLGPKLRVECDADQYTSLMGQQHTFEAEEPVRGSKKAAVKRSPRRT